MEICILFSKEGYNLLLLPLKMAPKGLVIDTENKTWKYVDPTNESHSTEQTYKVGESVSYNDKSWVRGVYDSSDFEHLQNLVSKTEAHYSENPGGRHRPGETI